MKLLYQANSRKVLQRRNDCGRSAKNLKDATKAAKEGERKSRQCHTSVYNSLEQVVLAKLR